MSRTSTTLRSRSGCQVRTTTLRLRAVARQSIERTSSPRTYSRNESNSVPCPRTRTAERPSRSRRRASRDGRCLRDSNGGSERTTPGTATVRCRDARPSGPRARTVTPWACRSPRRTGCSGVCSSTRSPGVSRSGNRLPWAPAVGCQASRRMPVNRRPVGLATTSVDEVGSPIRTGAVGRRVISSRAGLGASSTSTATASATASNHSHIVPNEGRSTTGSRPSSTSSGTRPEIAISAGRGPTRARSRAPAPPARPRARPRAAARAGGRGSPGPAPSRRRG